MLSVSVGTFARRYRVASLLVGTVILSAFVLPACGGGGTDVIAPPGATATTMSVIVTSTPATGSVLVGATRQFAVIVKDQNGALIGNQTAVWSIVGTSGIASITAGGGLATCVGVGGVTVHAIGPLNGSGTALTGDADLPCVAAPTPVPVALAITVTSTPSTGSVLVGATRQFAVSVKDQNGALIGNQTAVWSIVGTSGIASITAGGGLATCLAVGSVTVHAIGPLNGAGTALTGDATLQCIVPPPVPTVLAITVTSTPATGPVFVNSTRQYAIVVTDQYGAAWPNPTVAWSIVGAAGIAAISPTTGLASCVAPGTVTVHAIGPLNGAGTALTGDVSLQCVALNANPAVTMVLTPSTVSVGASSATGSFTATVVASFVDAAGSPTTSGCVVGFTTASSMTATVSGGGLTATITGVAAGTTALRASCTSGGTLTSLARVQVTSAPFNVAKVTLTPRYVYFPASMTSASSMFIASAFTSTGTSVPSAPIAYSIAGGSAATIDGMGTVSVSASTGGGAAGGPAFRGGAVVTATSGGQSEIGFVTYGDAGTIRGQVTSASGGYVGGTTATASNFSTGFSTTSRVTYDGYFYLVGLAPGTYTVQIDGPISGQTQSFQNVAVIAGQQTALTVTAWP